MKRRILYFFVTLIILLYNSFAFASRDIRRVKVIEFRDLYYLSKYEIIDKVDVIVKGDEIIIDVDSLTGVLGRHPLVKTFKIIEKENRLIISVLENEPVFLLALRKGNRLILFEFDERFRLLCINKAHALKMPLIIVTEDEINGKRLSSGLKKFLSLLLELSEDKLSVLEEISEIDLTGMPEAKILLNERRTTITFHPTKKNFYKLNYSVAYFDRIRYYPETMEIVNGLGVLK